ncbi:MAG TPA: ABC transporter ATP-binding protein [Nitrospira sp.]|nr:ABC transporter ATP-binding protein [Nitrospira sp.]
MATAANTVVSMRSSNVNTPVKRENVISIGGVTKIFETRQGRLRALDPIDLEIRNKEFVCLIGPSGCGKSTILGMIAGLVKPTDGRLNVDGRTIEEARKANQIGLVFQDAVLLPWRTVAENVSLPLEVLKIPRSERDTRIKAVLKLVKLEGFERRFPHELSGGMRQRLGIARALSFDPRVLLMDEPFGALDAITRDKMSIELLRIWEQQQKTVLFVTHSISEAAFLSDRVVVMTARPGRVAVIIENPLPRPRPLNIRDSAEFAALSRQLRNLLEDG